MDGQPWMEAEQQLLRQQTRRNWRAFRLGAEMRGNNNVLGNKGLLMSRKEGGGHWWTRVGRNGRTSELRRAF